jgi:hypothetical protein
VSGSAKRPAVALSEDDHRLLWFLAEHRMVLDRQIAALLDRPCQRLDRRLDELENAGYLARFGGWGNSPCSRIEKPGLAAVGSELLPPKDTPGAFRHDVGVAWLWLAAQRGSFGPLAEVIGERRLRSLDMAAPDRPFSVRLGGYDGFGNLRRHYPDLVLIHPSGRRLALELELSSKGVARRDTILAGYGADRRLEGVVYFVEDSRTGKGIGRRIQASAAGMGVADHVRLRTLRLEDGRLQEVVPVGRGGCRAPSRRAAPEVAR